MRLLTINTGSSSLKATLYDVAETERLILSAQIERIGQEGSHLRINDARAKPLDAGRADSGDHRAAVDMVLSWLQQHQYGVGLAAVGHRIVHGGSAFSQPQIISDEMVVALRRIVPIDPDHLPQALDAVAAVGAAYLAIPQVACFDTAFHRHMPRVAQLYALPHHLTEAGVRRYGFHGLSYESIMHGLRALDPHAAGGKVIIAHLGNGASMAAVHNGRSIDTTMGLTPTGGLVMGTRVGDLDPGVLLYLLQGQQMSPDALNTLVNRQAGLLGVSGSTADMRDLLAREATDARAADAVALFCYQARKFLGALAAALGGVETLVFTGGIGEHAAPVRARICADLEFLGIDLDAQRNAANAAIISRAGAPTTVRVMATAEDLMIAQHTHRVIANSPIA